LGFVCFSVAIFLETLRGDQFLPSNGGLSIPLNWGGLWLFHANLSSPPTTSTTPTMQLLSGLRHEGREGQGLESPIAGPVFVNRRYNHNPPNKKQS